MAGTKPRDSPDPQPPTPTSGQLLNSFSLRSNGLGGRTFSRTCNATATKPAPHLYLLSVGEEPLFP